MLGRSVRVRNSLRCRPNKSPQSRRSGKGTSLDDPGRARVYSCRQLAGNKLALQRLRLARDAQTNLRGLKPLKGGYLWHG